MTEEPAAILEIDPAWRREIEDMGSKPKFWFRYQDEMWLFKQARPNTGEHWAEKVASEIAVLLKLPTHEVRLARHEGRMGCAVRSFLKKDHTLVHGNEVLAGAIEGYDKGKHRGQADHNFQNIVNALEKRFRTPEVRLSVSKRFVGYLVLDALVGNTDRHHENWGIVIKPVVQNDTGGVPVSKRRIGLAPTFDHGSSLGRELLEDRARQLVADPQAINRYIRKATGGIFQNARARKGMSPIALVELIAATYPELVRPWKDRVAALPEDFAAPMISSVPASCMTEASREFVLAFLSASRKMITKIL